MPVRFETTSEYNQNFLGPNAAPPSSQPVAGLKSEEIANVHEPRLQSRRKPIDLTRTSTTYLDEGPAATDEYILVGDQSKFAPSVKYRVLEKNGVSKAAQPKGTTGDAAKSQTEPTQTQSEHKVFTKQKYKSDRKNTKNGEAQKVCPVHPDGKSAKGSVSAPDLQTRGSPEAAQPKGTTEKPPNKPTETQSEHKTHTKQKSKSDKVSSKNGKANKTCPVHHEGKSAKGSVPVLDLQNNDSPQADGPSAENGVAPPRTAERSPPPAPRERDIAPAVTKRKPDNYISRPTKPTLKTRPPPPPKQSKTKPVVPKLAIKSPKDKENEPEVLQRRPADPREKRSGKFNEFVQTDLEKGVADSGQEAPADYAMKYRAGIPPPRPRGPKRLSEYQMQYQWKKGVNSSPLLAAEQIIYNSNPQLAPYSNPDLPPKQSEYDRAYVKYDYKPAPVEVLTPPKKTKLKRSKSLEVITAAKDTIPNDIQAPTNRTVSPDKLRAAGLRSGKRTEEDKRLLRESLNPTHLLFPHGRVRNIGSEYASNYANPTRFSYEDGVWKGADPPHIQPTKIQVDVSCSGFPRVPVACIKTKQTPAPVNIKKPAKAAAPEAPAPDTNWYREVIELRNKAQEYKQRARGTHFSRSHLAQLYAQQADLWDTVSNSSTLSALSLESAAAMAAASRQAPSDTASTASTVSQREPPAPKAAPKEAWGGDVPSSAKSKSTSRRKSKAIVSLQGSPPGSAGGSGSTLVAGSAESEQGRVPTPKFRKEHDQAGYKWRHHLDRTTPAVGGALLTSPPQRKKSKSRTKSEPALKMATSAPKLSSSWAGPASGLPTRDSHVLVDEEASTDRPLPTKYTQSPPIDKQNKKFHLGVDVMPTLRETLREMATSTGEAVEDDVLSISARSVASSCSLASEVLERARNRRDEFWGNNSKKASRS